MARPSLPACDPAAVRVERVELVHEVCRSQAPSVVLVPSPPDHRVLKRAIQPGDVAALVVFQVQGAAASLVQSTLMINRRVYAATVTIATWLVARGTGSPDSRRPSI